MREYAAARTSYEEALAIDRRALPSGHPDIAETLTNLGNLQRPAGVSRRRRATRRRWPSDRRALPEGPPDIANSLNNLGNVQCDLREYAAARKSYEEALAIRRRALPKDHPDIAISLTTWGSCRAILRDYAAAKTSHEEALAIRRRALPEGPPRHRHEPDQPGDRAVVSAGLRGGEEEL